MRLIIDVMSGDAEALEAVKGAVKANSELDVDVTLVGDEKIINDALASMGVAADESLKVVHAASVVTMDDDYLVVIVLYVRKRMGKNSCALCICKLHIKKSPL